MNTIKLTENKLKSLIKEAVRDALKNHKLNEGNQWIGNGYCQDNFNVLRQKAAQMQGNCSFELNGVDFTLQQTQRGIHASSGSNNGFDALDIESALKWCWQMSWKLRQNQ